MVKFDCAGVASDVFVFSKFSFNCPLFVELYLSFVLLLPMLPVIINRDVLSSNLSLYVESVLPSSLFVWNTTDLYSSSEDNIIVYRHPVLYGAAIYALLLIIIGTIGK